MPTRYPPDVEELPSHRSMDSVGVLSLPKSSQDETSKDANAGDSFPGRSKDPQEYHTMPDILDAAHIVKLLSANSRLLSLQNNVASKRSEVQELRTALRFQREEEAEIRGRFISHLTAAQGTLTSLQPLLQDNEALLVATGEYSDMETDYNKAESQLERDEYALIKAMEEFARLSSNHSLPAPEETSPIEQHHLSGVGSTASSVPEDPPDVVEYVSRLADVRMVQERLCDLDRDLLLIQEKQAERASLNIPMDDECLEFLRTYDEERGEIWAELSIAQQDVNQLRTVCFKKGHLTDEYIRGRDFLPEIHPVALANQPRDPLKASTEEDTSPFYPLEETMSSNQFVNKWLLHRLRQSNVEIGHLKSLPEIQSLCDRGYDGRKVSQLSLNNWFEDEASRSPPPPPDTSDMSAQGPGSATNTVSKGHSLP
ncbi:hypothetical protein BDV28DRAFT_146615 [Aspergillus coremiiformis]|uniref:Uncharacterized protein n=1 Tax=Aspergillus coremiiformis TaxID=138285 RepID=A0A5N6ZFM9_9EURO|nr:hypothetical protein BDV28DRAFT_146615 [Aspergillus coremiiformis]